MRVCQITGAKPKMGGRVHRSGLAKKKGGIGRHVTKHIKRQFSPNLQKKRIFIPELNEWVTLRVTPRALKTIDKNGAFATLKKAGLLVPVDEISVVNQEEA